MVVTVVAFVSLQKKVFEKKNEIFEKISLQDFFVLPLKCHVFGEKKIRKNCEILSLDFTSRFHFGKKLSRSAEG